MDEWAFLLERTLQSWRAAGEPQRVLAAVSGGADSAALLLVLADLSRKEGFSLTAAHVDHGLREASGQDAAFTAQLCRDAGVPCRVIRVRVAGSGEDAAREARYDALFEACADADAQALALAHHLRDQAETMLLHLFRGAGGVGLGGMAESAERMLPNGRSLMLWRPFLSIAPERIREALAGRGISWREDETNCQDRYLRNYLRHAVLPAVEARLPQAEEALARAAGILREEEDFFRREAADFLARHACLLPPCRWIDGSALSAVHPALKRNILRLGCPVKLDHGQTERLLHLEKGQAENLPQSWRALRTEKYLHFLPPEREKMPQGTLTVLPWQGQTGDGVRTQALPRAVWVGCVLRTWEPGDRIRPLGAPGEKKMQDYWVDRHIPRPFRPYMPLLCRGNQVIWAVGAGPGEEARTLPGDDAVLLRYDGFLPGEKIIEQQMTKGEQNP